MSFNYCGYQNFVLKKSAQYVCLFFFQTCIYKFNLNNNHLKMDTACLLSDMTEILLQLYLYGEKPYQAVSSWKEHEWKMLQRPECRHKCWRLPADAVILHLLPPSRLFYSQNGEHEEQQWVKKGQDGFWAHHAAVNKGAHPFSGQIYRDNVSREKVSGCEAGASSGVKAWCKSCLISCLFGLGLTIACLNTNEQEVEETLSYH